MISGNKNLSLGTSIYLDVNVFIYAIEGYLEFEPFLSDLFDKIDSGKLQAVTSELTLAEALVKPMLDENKKLERVYLEAIQSSFNLKVVPISRDILIGAARIRSKMPQFRLPDAIHLMTAKTTQCQSFLTNDKQIKSCVEEMNVVLLSEAILR